MITDERKKELASMSDAWLKEMLGIRAEKLVELRWEFDRRFPPPETKKLVELPCTLQELETAVHVYGDHNGFHGKVNVILESVIDSKAKDYLAVAEEDTNT